jgi:UDP-N-acetylmuramate: L-alanyl-gamma-D-glutamyl-meso-diaminopimelate ligase
MNIHFIAIGGAAMHNLALALQREGHTVTGSDDEIFEPSRTRLLSASLLPQKEGWYPERIHAGLDAVVLGMHAKSDNPELQRAEELGLHILSYPAFFTQYTLQKTRVVVGGSHGKTTTTSMIIHALQAQNIRFDCLVGATIPGISAPVLFDSASSFAIIEGDEYLSSAREPIPKFHVYKGHIGVITGIAWDHVNVFKTLDDYRQQFYLFIDTLMAGGHLIYCAEDLDLVALVESHPRKDIQKHAYTTLPYRYNDATALVHFNGQEYPLGFQGRHNIQNLGAALVVNRLLGGSDESMLLSMAHFKGAARRMEEWKRREELDFLAIKDFAHSPSKVKATVQAVREAYPNHRLMALLELHTYSSLNKDFLPGYRGAFLGADAVAVLYDPNALTLKKLPLLNPLDVANSMDIAPQNVFDDPQQLQALIQAETKTKTVFLCMSSGNWGGIDLESLL